MFANRYYLVNLQLKNFPIRAICCATILLFSVVDSFYAQKINIGSYEFSDGAIYQGELAKGKPNGRGITHFKNGDRYEGEFVNGMRHGQGIFTWAEGSYYEGAFHNGVFHGQGTFVGIDGSCYEGTFE